ncbi:lantibiotic dehydratase [Actinacidiphila oryziradicis]|uniref:lantibiotic dehydratase n=1 Tax=Actinacidiphila oryziradicis TaxID=2571141 RepID=UPI0023F14D74|nr:lantibiotic dehydratase [Actinacidiphila oryziradicis]
MRLANVITRLEACPELLRRLPAIANPTCFVRGRKLVVLCQQPPHDGRGAPAKVSVSHTRACWRPGRWARPGADRGRGPGRTRAGRCGRRGCAGR